MAAKRPTGERPKQLSTLAKTVKSAARGGVASKSGKVEVLTPSQAAARAGKMRDRAAQNRKGAMTPTERAKLKKELKPLNEGSRSKAGASTVAAVAKRFGVTAREARDIATAIGTYGTLKFDPDSKYDRYSTQKIEKAKAVKNIKKQISETITAAKTGKKGTTSGRATFSDGEVPYTYSKGKKRK